MDESQYFKDVHEIYLAGKHVIIFDYVFQLCFEDKEYPSTLRCHSVGKGRYEIELWIPGFITNAVAD